VSEISGKGGNNMKTALVIMVHGSPNPESNQAVLTAAEMIRRRGAFSQVEIGFLECNEPDIPTAIEKCISAGAEGIVASPYFLHTGNHVANDIPEILEAAQKKYPNIQFLMTNIVGSSEKVTDVLEQRANEVS
jgi:sirohydrochlorin ferrochelatase